VRYRVLGHDRFLDGRPLRFLGVLNGYVAGWLPGGTVRAAPVLGDGRPLRAVEAADWFTTELASVRRPWSGYGLLMLVPLAGAHSVWLFWDEDGAFGNWYVNLERPHFWQANGCDTRDTLLDVVCDAPRRWRWKDEDELELAVAVGAITREDAEGVRAEGERVVAAIERWESPFADGWERWRPDPRWPAPELPADWDA
jgi:predicted RNA-binding protein associated with RNAse of E/G family